MALKLLNHMSTNQEPEREPRAHRKNMGKKYREGSQGILKRKRSIQRIKSVKRVSLFS